MVTLAYVAGMPSAGGRTLVLAHRGDSTSAPENTLAAIESSAAKADLAEFDVRVSADGKLVLMHDSTVDRTTNGTGLVAGKTLAELQALDAGSWFSPAYAGEPVPTLAEAISESVTSEVEPVVERKAGSAVNYHNEFVQIGIGTTEFRVISFSWSFLNDLNALDPTYNLGALGAGTIDQTVIDTVKSQGADFLDWSHNLISQATVDLVHANDLELVVYTVDDVSRMRQLIDYGVDGITTNRPEILYEIVTYTSEWADLNEDGTLDVSDWLVYNAGRGADFTGLSYSQAHALGDLDFDFDNDLTDFIQFKFLYEQANGIGAFQSLLAIPEPSSVSLTLLGLLTLGMTHRNSASMSRLSLRIPKNRLNCSYRRG
ncbi:glycerophosphodiester phosphodiesterase [Adhaeretor mobilis]|uniref:glycerophosphodiester phosphodiesterase n=1 Tax=Adhaeretor mobilis TaxID=1930276 RepID=UPI00119D960A|nr:glycerophosphodiester phosphodiesterase family protein [Adhaeretor mobilis]